MTTYKLLFAQENYELLYNIIRDDFNDKLLTRLLLICPAVIE